MALAPYTTYADVRAACGVTEEEVPDAVLSLQLYELTLLRDLKGVSASLAADFGAWSADGAPALQQAAASAVKLFATYAVARTLSVGLPLAAPKDIGDGKATLARFADAPYRAVIERVQAEYEKALAELRSAVEALSGGSTSTSYGSTFLVSSPSFDPVLGS